MPEARPLLCIASSPRTGSNALRSILRGWGPVGDRGSHMDFGEIFHTDRSIVPLPFLSFLEQQPEPVATLFDDSRGWQAIQTYLDLLTRTAGERGVMVDVKLTSWHTIRPAWTYLHDEPLFMRTLKRANARFIFLWRRDLAAQMISQEIALRTNVWHEANRPQDLNAPFALDAVDLARQARLMCLNEAAIYEHLLRYQPILTLAYEDIFDAAGRLTDATAAALAIQAGADLVVRRPEQERNLIAKPDAVLNYREVASTVRATAALYRHPNLRS